MAETNQNAAGKVDFDFPISGKIAVITGAGSGIGAAVATAFASKGAQVVLLDLNAQAVESMAASLENAKSWVCDVTDAASVENVISQVEADFGRIDILVNSAGIVDLAPAEELTQSAWQRTLDVNLTGSFNTCQAVGKRMIRQKSGKIVNLASQAGTVAIDGHVAYCASKFAIIGMSKTMALEWGPHGITVNTISPTVVLTELGRKAWEGPKGEALKKEIPTGRFAEPEEIAAAAVFLSSPASDMINGADLLVDGGFTIK